MAIVVKNKYNNPEERKNIQRINNPYRKVVYGFIDGKLLASWDSISLCAISNGLPRSIIKLHIESGNVLESGYVLKLNK